MNREVLAKSLIANSNIEIGSVITEEMIDIMSPGQGLQPNRIYDLVGKKLTRPIQKGDYFFDSDINGGYEKKAKYKFDRPYGIPVRFHDFEALTDGIQLDFVEFHLSYKDLEVDLDDYINKNQNIGFAVHAPELFEGDHILDLASYDESYRQRSIGELANVIEKTKKLRDYFPITKKPVIVINAGGWNADKFLSLEEKKKKYALVKKSLEQLDLSDVEIAIQTMPPFPWHFGGQSHHNLFVDPNEIYQFCSESNIKICLDVSHTMMACNFYSWDLYDFVKLISPYNVHMHIVDAKGIDGEGIQIGEGDVDFDKLAEILQKTSPNVQFIPEVWQGHKNSGEGFWQALNYLEYKLN
jgi:N-acetylneuraminate synthase